ncbi:hypothetical protein [Leptospira santarosai]|uniref:hypothetical protein n=1 Tax=Leptospira santarosai TaxID=28183 RepID=UPI000517BD58|nr:hypothetical protein [Leptospira santarosai]
MKQYKFEELKLSMRLEDNTTSIDEIGRDMVKLEILRTKHLLLKYYVKKRNWSEGNNNWQYV